MLKLPRRQHVATPIAMELEPWEAGAVRLRLLSPDECRYQPDSRSPVSMLEVNKYMMTVTFQRN